jgi:DNA-directed RNA polymerase subunit RPC12/RpoP
MYATVRIYSHAASDSLAIPSEAVIHSGKRKIVFVTKGDGKFEPREIKIGAESDDGYLQIISGLFDHEEVVVSGQFLLDSESRTREAIAKMRATQAQRAQEASKEEEKGEHESHDMKPDVKPHEGHTEMETPFYACPMHPKFITTDPNAKCPECEMNVVKIEELGDKVDLEKAEFYTCPMHPDFLTTDKNGRCPECGMKLEKAKK